MAGKSIFPNRIRNFFGLKQSRDQDGANKKKFSQIGPAVPEEIGRKQTNTHANIVLLYKRDKHCLECMYRVRLIKSWRLSILTKRTLLIVRFSTFYFITSRQNQFFQIFGTTGSWIRNFLA